MGGAFKQKEMVMLIYNNDYAVLKIKGISSIRIAVDS